MDILHLIDRLEQVMNDGQRIMLTAKIIVDEDRIYNVIDQMRVAIPEAVKRANRLETEKDRILAQAHEEADRLRDLATQEAEELVRRDVITETAKKRADNILERARHDADIMRQDADVYTVDVLAKLEEDLLRSLSVVRNGLIKLQDAPSDSQSQSARESVNELAVKN
jgi:cell division septum initiation protein DivIVA